MYSISCTFHDQTCTFSCTFHEVIKAINSPKLKKTAGVDKISNDFLSEASDAVTPYLTNMIILSLESGTLPSQHKKAKLTRLDVNFIGWM